MWVELLELVDAGGEPVDSVVEAFADHSHDAALVDIPGLGRDPARAERGDADADNNGGPSDGDGNI